MGCFCCNNNYKKKSVEEKIQDRMNALYGDKYNGDKHNGENAPYSENTLYGDNYDSCNCKDGNCSCDGHNKEIVTVLDWIKMKATAEEIVEFFSQGCSDGDKYMWCESFESCKDCKVSWLKSKWKG